MILTPLISPLELICTVCLLPVVRDIHAGGKSRNLDEHLDPATAGRARPAFGQARQRHLPG